MSKAIAIVVACLIPAYAMAEDGANDVKNPSVGPNSVHIAICAGTDIDKREILLADRLCLNRQSVVEVTAAIDQMQRERNKLIDKLNEVANAKAEQEKLENQKIILGAVGGAGAAAAVITAVLLGLKATGNLK